MPDVKFPTLSSFVKHALFISMAEEAAAAMLAAIRSFIVYYYFIDLQEEILKLIGRI